MGDRHEDTASLKRTITMVFNAFNQKSERPADKDQSKQTHEKPQQQPQSDLAKHVEDPEHILLIHFPLFKRFALKLLDIIGPKVNPFLTDKSKDPSFKELPEEDRVYISAFLAAAIQREQALL